MNSSMSSLEFGIAKLLIKLIFCSSVLDIESKLLLFEKKRFDLSLSRLDSIASNFKANSRTALVERTSRNSKPHAGQFISKDFNISPQFGHLYIFPAYSCCGGEE